MDNCGFEFQRQQFGGIMCHNNDGDQFWNIGLCRVIDETLEAAGANFALRPIPAANAKLYRKTLRRWVFPKTCVGGGLCSRGEQSFPGQLLQAAISYVHLPAGVSKCSPGGNTHIKPDVDSI